MPFCRHVHGRRARYYQLGYHGDQLDRARRTARADHRHLRRRSTQFEQHPSLGQRAQGRYSTQGRLNRPRHQMEGSSQPHLVPFILYTQSKNRSLRSGFFDYFLTSLKISRLRVVGSNFFNSSFRSTFFLFLLVQMTCSEDVDRSFIRFTCDIQLEYQKPPLPAIQQPQLRKARPSVTIGFDGS